MLTPVSYTHLKAVFMQETGGDRIIAGQGFDQCGTQDHLPVSYTHLDVYKRQVFLKVT